MSSFKDRITFGAVQRGEPTNPDLTIKGTLDGPSEIPLVRIRIFPGIIGWDIMQPLIASDGAPIAATSTGSWGQLYAAGRMG